MSDTRRPPRKMKGVVVLNPITRPSIRAVCFALACCAWFSGCEAVPVPTSILAGTWDLLGEGQDDDNKTVLVIDSAGELDEVRTVLGNITTTNEDPVGEISLTGQEVSIAYNTGLSTRRFEGTFNADFTVATGDLFLDTEFFGSTVTVEEGPGTLIRTE